MYQTKNLRKKTRPFMVLVVSLVSSLALSTLAFIQPANAVTTYNFDCLSVANSVPRSVIDETAYLNFPPEWGSTPIEVDLGTIANNPGGVEIELVFQPSCEFWFIYGEFIQNEEGTIESSFTKTFVVPLDGEPVGVSGRSWSGSGYPQNDPIGHATYFFTAGTQGGGSGSGTPTIDTRIVVPGAPTLDEDDQDGGTVPNPAFPTETSGIGKLNPGEGVEFTSAEGLSRELDDALYISGEKYGDGTYLTHPVPFRYEELLGYAKGLGVDVCVELTITYYMYDSEGTEVATASAIMEGDPTDESCSGSGDNGSGGSSGSSSGSIKSKPATPDESRVKVTSGANSLDVAMSYSGTSSSKPTSYKVTVFPGGNSCIATGSNSSCEVLGLKNNVLYTVSVEAINGFGSSGSYAAPGTYIFTANGLVSMSAKKTIDKFPGDSPQLLNSLKSRVKKFIAKHPEITNFTCTGYTAGPVKKSDKVLAKTRASNVCAYIERIKPSVSTTTIGKTPGLPWGPANRKVVIRGYSAIG